MTKKITEGIYTIIYIHIHPKGHGCDKYEQDELFSRLQKMY